MNIILKKSDTFGALASMLCLIHCIATPFIFIVHTCSLGGCSTTPTWWQSIDYLFLVISLIAIYHSTKNTSSRFIKPFFWGFWILLLMVIVNEKLSWISIPAYSIYIPAIALIILHVYNLKYCQCKNDKCCVKNE